MRTSLLVTLLVVASTPALAADKPVPKYEGKPLEYWVQQFQKAETEKQRDAAAVAIVTFGPSAAPAVPELIDMLSDLSRTYRNQVIEILCSLGPTAKEARPAIAKIFGEEETYRQSDTFTAFIALSPEPKEAVPYLVPFLTDSFNGYQVCLALCAAGPDAKEAIPAIRRLVMGRLADKEKDPRGYLFAFEEMHKLGPDVVPLLVEMLTEPGGHGRKVALDCLEKLGPKAIKAKPVLLALLKNDDLNARYLTAKALGQIEKHPAVVPVLTELLTAEASLGRGDFGRIVVEQNLAADAARTLGELGPDAKAALPALREAVAIGLPASVLERVYFDLALARDNSSTVFEQVVRFRALVTVAEAAAEAIEKIEGKAKK